MIEPTPNELSGARRYSLVIRWSDEDQAYIVTVPELEGCITHGASWEEAVCQAHDSIVTWLVAARSWDDPIPPPRLFDPTDAFAHAGQ